MNKKLCCCLFRQQHSNFDSFSGSVVVLVLILVIVEVELELRVAGRAADRAEVKIILKERDDLAALWTGDLVLLLVAAAAAADAFVVLVFILVLARSSR